MLSWSGVEVLQKQYAPHLLNIDGDSCNHVHNITKALCEPFESWLERLFTDLHLDFKYCTQYKKIMTEICRICDVNFTASKRFISHRWLNAYDQAIETSRLLNVYIIFYSAFLPVHLREQYTRQVNSLRSFISNECLPFLGNSCVDLWWTQQNLTPSLKKIANAALSIFHGPQVESSFSLMKDVFA